jgi:hypothetical protein
MAGCGALHLVAAADSAATSGVQVLVLLGMALACMPCATHALLAPTRRTWIQAGLVSAGMLGAHPLLGLLPAGHVGHAGSSIPVVVGMGMVTGPAVALGLACFGAIAGRSDPLSPGARHRAAG